MPVSEGRTISQVLDGVAPGEKAGDMSSILGGKEMPIGRLSQEADGLPVPFPHPLKDGAGRPTPTPPHDEKAVKSIDDGSEEKGGEDLDADALGSLLCSIVSDEPFVDAPSVGTMIGIARLEKEREDNTSLDEELFGSLLGGMVAEIPMSDESKTNDVFAESVVADVSPKTPIRTTQMGERVNPEALINGILGKAIASGSLSGERGAFLKAELMDLAEMMQATAQSDIPFGVNGFKNEFSVLRNYGLSDAEIELMAAALVELKDNIGIFGDADNGVAIRSEGTIVTKGALSNPAFLSALPDWARMQIKKDTSEGKIREISHEEYRRQIQAGARLAATFCTRFVVNLKAFEKQQTEKNKILHKERPAGHRAALDSRLQTRSLSDDTKAEEIKDELLVREKKEERGWLAKELSELSETRRSRHRRERNELKAKEEKGQEYKKEIIAEEQKRSDEKSRQIKADQGR